MFYWSLARGPVLITMIVNFFFSEYKILLCHNKAEILLKLALNTNQSIENLVSYSGSKSVQVFHCLFISVLLLEIQFLRGKCWDLINRLNLTIFLCLSQARTWISINICRCLFCIQWFEVRVCCVFCWYWSNCY